MLTSLQVQNYALIRNLEIEFTSGFTIITGETGAGKSILLGALSLLLGQRADTSVLLNKEKKCVVEGAFSIKKYKIGSFFKMNDIDYEDLTIIRREISPSGKSRAFINDTPVNLNQLRELGLQLVDIHSQHENLNLGNHQFQLMIIDTVADHSDLLNEFQSNYNVYKEKLKELDELKREASQAKSDLDYFSFQLEQLEEAKLQEGESENLEEEANTLAHAEDIKFNLLKTTDIISGDGTSVLNLIRDAIHSLDKLSDYFPIAKELRDRMESTYIELKDIASEAAMQGDNVEIDPGRLQYVQERLDLINSLFHKHSLSSVKELIELRISLKQKIQDITSFDEKIENLTGETDELYRKLDSLANSLSKNRLKTIPDVEKRIITMLKQLGIPNARFTISHRKEEAFTPNGLDMVEFLFSANKQANLQEIARVASGGELSRLMLSIKSLISHTLELPTIIFDELDAGVSGEIAEKVGNIMKQMSAGKQIINITHLPQVAARGDFHYLVFKFDKEGATQTDIKRLSDEDRVLELAKMLSGEELTEAAISNARELLN